LGYTYADRGIKLEEALDLINRALTVKPDDGYFIDSLGWTYYKMGKIDEALAQLNRAVALVPDDAVIQEHLGEIYLKKSQMREAKEAWLRSLELDPDNNKLVDRYKMAGFGDPAKEERIQKARLRDPKSLSLGNGREFSTEQTPSLVH
jgi:tetratricopeptide (TPR) repeat protein